MTGLSKVKAGEIGTTILTNEIGLPMAVRVDNGTARSMTLALSGGSIVADPSPNGCARLMDRAIQWIMQDQARMVVVRPELSTEARPSIAHPMCQCC